MSKQLTVSVAAISAEFERRMQMASRLLAAYKLEVSIQPWDGIRRDLLLANVDDAYGRNACAIADRRGDLVLKVSMDPTQQANANQINVNIPVAELTRILKAMLQTSPSSTHTADILMPSLDGLGLPGVWRQEWSADRDFSVSHGNIVLVILRQKSLVVCRSPEDSSAAKEAFLSTPWVAERAPQLMPSHGDGLEKPVDVFLLESCVANEDRLPLLEGRLALASWPDLGALANCEDMLRLAAALSARSRSTQDLAERCSVSGARANAFCWAMYLGGLLTSEQQPFKRPANRASADTRSIVSRLAKRFGMFVGAET